MKVLLPSSVADPNPKESAELFDGSESEKKLDLDPTITGDGKNVSICFNYHKQKYK
jgi:hypothetical protein